MPRKKSKPKLKNIAKVLLSNLYILVTAKKYDLFLAGNSLTESRAKIVDHSFPIILTSVRMIYLRHSESASDSSTWVYTQSFLVISWIVIASMTLLTFVIYFFLQRLANKVHTGCTIRFWHKVKTSLEQMFWQIHQKLMLSGFLSRSIIWNFSDLTQPQQPPTEKVLKSNMSFHDSFKRFFFQNIQINSWNYWIQESGRLSSDLTLAAYATSPASPASKYWFPQKKNSYPDC